MTMYSGEWEKHIQCWVPGTPHTTWKAFAGQVNCHLKVWGSHPELGPSCCGLAAAVGWGQPQGRSHTGLPRRLEAGAASPLVSRPHGCVLGELGSWPLQ